MAEDNAKIIWYLSVWLMAAAIIFFSQLRKNSIASGLSLAYLFNLWLIHWVASALYALPWYSYYNLDDVVAGLEQSTYAVVSFSVGYLTLSYVLSGAFLGQHPQHKSPLSAERSQASGAWLTNLYIGIGAICFLIGILGQGKLPTVTSLIAGASNLAVVGLMLKSWRAWQSGNRKSFWLWVMVSSAYPLLTVITQGFIGYGIFNTMMVFTFVARFYRPRWRLAVLGLAAGYLGLSLYVTYMRDRSEIRDTVWGGQSYGSRVDQLKATFSRAEFFDLNNDEHLERIDLRLNQNALVGASVHYIGSGQQGFASGETLWQAIIALIPRIVWPEKPVEAGSGNLVSKYTGHYFAEGTSVGIGHVMEFYINFGQWGVVIGFLILGIVIALIDKGAGKSIANNDWLTFACWYLPGAALLQVGGSFVEVTASAAASLSVAMSVKWLVSWRRYGAGGKRDRSCVLTTS
ncbi:MAG: O-antigen polysaccharide polymerase Wzy family protein [Acidobacteria bacterium]|nr:O-antigen polysaccharide polymerase Wzy family protein [Acidobacteriota bacterium]